MTYRIVAAGAVAALLCLGGCASTATKEAAAAPEAAPAEIASKNQPKVLERSAPTAQEIESPLKAGEGEGLPIIAQGDTPVGEGAPRSATPPIPAERPGGSPAVESVIDMPTKDLHGAAFPGMGTAPKSTSAPRTNDAVNQRIADIEKQLMGLKEVAAKPAAGPGPDPGVINAVQARLDELNAKINAVESGQQKLAAQAAPQNTGVDAARIEGIEKQLDALKNAMETRDDASASAKQRAEAEKSTQERLNNLTGQIDGLTKALEHAKTKPAKGGVSSDELTTRLAALQERMDALQAQAAPKTDAESDKRLDALSEKIAALEKAQQPQPVNTGVAPERVEAIEKQLADLRSSVSANTGAISTAKKSAPQEAFYKTFADQMKDVEKQIADLDAYVSRAATQPTPGGMPSDELVKRVQAMQEQIDSLQTKVASAAPAKSAADPTLQARIDELTKKIEAIQQDQAARPTPAPAPVPDARFDKIEQQIQGIQEAMQKPKAAAPAPEALDQRFSALEAQLNGLRGELEKQAAAKTPPAGVDGLVHTKERREPGEYRLGAGDKLQFQSFNDEKLSREEITVRFDGHISLPLIPDIAVGNLTRAEAEERIREEYRTIFRDPQIALIVREAASKSYTVVGDIEKPGVYPFTTETNLIEAISIAGGLRRRSSSSSVGGFVGVTGQLTKAFVVRTMNGEREVLQYDLRGLGKRGAHDSEMPIYYGDLIYVPEGVNLVYLLGESRNPVIVELTEGMKLLQLLALSGGFNASTAKLNGVVLMRQTDEDNTRIMKMNVKEILRTGKDFPLVPGDIVYIPRKRLIVLEEFVQRFTGSISPVLNLYTSAVDAYYAKDLQQSLLNSSSTNSTLNVLNNLDNFGKTTADIVDLFRRP